MVVGCAMSALLDAFRDDFPDGSKLCMPAVQACR